MGYEVAIIFTMEIPVYEAVSDLHLVTTQSKTRERHLVTPRCKTRENYWREMPRFYTCELY